MEKIESYLFALPSQNRIDQALFVSYESRLDHLTDKTLTSWDVFPLMESLQLQHFQQKIPTERYSGPIKYIDTEAEFPEIHRYDFAGYRFMLPASYQENGHETTMYIGFLGRGKVYRQGLVPTREVFGVFVMQDSARGEHGIPRGSFLYGPDPIHVSPTFSALEHAAADREKIKIARQTVSNGFASLLQHVKAA